MNRRQLLIVTGGLVAVWLLAAGALAASLAGFDLGWHVIAGGGGRSSSADYALSGSAGQPAVGRLSSANYRLSAGFWADIGSESPTPTMTGPPPATSTPSPTGTVLSTPGATATDSPPLTSTPTPTFTATFSPTRTATSTGSPPVISTPTATPTPSSTPGVPCENILPHGDFEAGLLPPWGTAGGTQVTTAHARGGSQGVRLGGTDNAVDELFTGFELPADATSMTLSYWWYVESTDPDPQADVLVVVVEGPGGAVVVETLTNDSPRDAWHETTFDLGSYAGQFVGVTFRAETAEENPTSFYVDDVQVEVCGTIAPGRRVHLPLVRR